MVLDCLKFAAAWATTAMALFLFLALTVFADWETSDKIALFQAFVGIAGFGAGLVLLAVTVSSATRK